MDWIFPYGISTAGPTEENPFLTNYIYNSLPTQNPFGGFFETNALTWEVRFEDVPQEWFQLFYGVKIWRARCQMSGGGASYSIDELFPAGGTTLIQDGVRVEPEPDDQIKDMEDLLAYMEFRSNASPNRASLRWQEGGSAAGQFGSLFVAPNTRGGYSTEEGKFHLNWIFLATIRVFNDFPEPDFNGQAGGGFFSEGQPTNGTALLDANEMPIEVDGGLSFELTVTPEEWL